MVVQLVFYGLAGAISPNLLIIAIVVGLALMIPSLAVGCRRLHDRNMSGWWLLGFVVLSLIPLLGIFASIAMLVIFFLPGTNGPNRFGDDPKNPSAQADVFD